MAGIEIETIVKNDIDYLPAFHDEHLFSYYGMPEAREVTNDGSEISYQSRFSSQMESSFIFLPFNIYWLAAVSMAVMGQYYLLSFKVFFSPVVFSNSTVVMLYIICLLLNLTDIFASSMHFLFKSTRVLNIYRKTPLVLVIFDCLTVLTVPIDIYHLNTTSNYALYVIVLVPVTYRLRRAIDFVNIITASPFRQSLSYVLVKYSIAVTISIHTVSCAWMYVGRDEYEEDIPSWTDDLDKNQGAFGKYWQSAYYMFGGITTIGIGGASSRNDNEAIIYIIMMLFSLFVMNGVFLGTFTDVQVDKNFSRSVFGSRLNLIFKAMSVLLRQMHIGFKRALAHHMKTVYFNVGDIILQQDDIATELIYVAKGVIQVVAPDDIESPILTLGYGTCIGDGGLMISYKNPATVVAASYCKLHILEKERLWFMIRRYRKLNQSKVIHNVFENMLIKAKIAKERKTRNFLLSKKKPEKSLKKIKLLLPIKLQEDTSLSYSKQVSCPSAKYIIKQTEAFRGNMDKIFVRTTWPWILYPKTQMLLIWDTIILIFSLFVIIIYPIVLLYLQNLPTFYVYYFRPIAYAVFIVDIILQLVTAYEDEEQNIISDLSAISIKKFTQIMFLMDLLSIVPFEIVFHRMGSSNKAGNWFELNHMLKIGRVLKYRENLTAGFKNTSSIFGILMYVIYIMYMAYLEGIVYYKVACPVRPCGNHSWMAIYKRTLNPEINIDDDASKDIIYVMLLYGVLILTGTGGKFFIDTTGEKTLIVAYIFFCIFLYTYILADYSAMLSLLDTDRAEFLGIAFTTRKYMLANKIDRSIIARCNIFLETQWLHSGGTQQSQQLMSEVPLPFFERYNNEMYQDLLFTIPIFKNPSTFFPFSINFNMLKSGQNDTPFLRHTYNPIYLIRRFQMKHSLLMIILKEYNTILLMLKRNILLSLCGKIVSETYPPNEVVTYAGCKSDEIYIIEKGYCLMISPASEKMIGPMHNFNVLDMLLEVPVLYHVRTLTNVSVLKITRDDFEAVTSSSDICNDLRANIQFCKNSAMVQRLFIRTDTRNEEYKVSNDYTGSFFVFPTSKLAPLNLDFQRGWSGFNLVRYILRRRTILPAGQFLYIYVIFHAVVVFISCMVNACLFVCETILPPYAIVIITVPIDLLLLLDVYIRLHVCYYNKKGILVTHPRLTAMNYITTSFAVDLISALPYKLIFRIFASNNYIVNYINLVKVLRAYRIPNAFDYCNRDILKGDTIIVSSAKFLILSIVILNTFSSVMVLIGCNIEDEPNNMIRLVPYNMSWIYTKQNAEMEIEKHNPSGAKIYLLAWYYMTCLSMQLGLGDVCVVQNGEIMYGIAVILLGFLWFTYILIILSNTRAVLNINLTRYQYHMKDLLTFMKRHRISKVIQNKCIDHFEYIWQRTQGTSQQEILSNFHTTVKADTILAMYYRTLSMVSVFKSADFTFYNNIGSNLKESYYLSRYVILQVNNIVDSIYIVHNGEVQILGPAGNRLVVLKKGGVFGNLDNVKHSRSMVTVISSSAVDLLEIPTSKFYSLTGMYPSIERNMLDVVIQKNLPYVVATGGRNTMCLTSVTEFITAEELSQKRTTLNKAERFLMTRYSEALFMLISFGSYIILIYHVAFHYPNITMLVLSYCFDVLHIAKVYVHFYIPYINRLGEIVTNKNLIKKRYIRQQGFYIDVIALIPIELLALVFRKNDSFYIYLSWFRLNRVLRLINIKNFFSVTDDYLNVNVMVIKLCANCIYFSMLLHTVTCFWYILACPFTICTKNSWVWTSVTKMDCVNPYICAMYYSASILTFTGYDVMLPRSIVDVSTCIFMCLFTKFIISLFISDMAAIVRHYGYRLGKFGQKVKVMKTHLTNGQISYKLQERMHHYIDQVWYKLNGRQMPVFLEIAPQCLAEEIKHLAFGHHLIGNTIFCDCHTDLLRLMINKTNLVTIFNDDLICKQGDIDNTMYFIHSGIVHVISETDTSDTVVDMMKSGDSFGMLQGLFPNTPHSHSYLSKSVTEVVTLNLYDWYYYLQFYPASKYLLYSIVKNYDYLLRRELA